MSDIKFQDPPKRLTDDYADVLAALLENPGRWALVAECITVNARQTWHSARRHVVPLTPHHVSCFLDDADRLARTTLSNLRPLVVLDLAANDLGVLSDAWANVERAMKDGHSLPIIIEHLRDQIEAQTKPPRIPEPGLWGVVEARRSAASKPTRWVHTPESINQPWVSVDADATSPWSDLIDPTLIREGLS